VGGEEKMQSSFAACSKKRLECRNTAPYEDPEITVCFLIAPCPTGKVCCYICKATVAFSSS